MANPSSSYVWLDRLVRAQQLLDRRVAEYQKSLDDPNGLIASDEWKRLERAAERRDAIRDKHWPMLLRLATHAVRNG